MTPPLLLPLMLLAAQVARAETNNIGFFGSLEGCESFASYTWIELRTWDDIEGVEMCCQIPFYPERIDWMTQAENNNTDNSPVYHAMSCCCPRHQGCVVSTYGCSCSCPDPTPSPTPTPTQELDSGDAYVTRFDGYNNYENYDRQAIDETNDKAVYDFYIICFLAVTSCLFLCCIVNMEERALNFRRRRNRRQHFTRMDQPRTHEHTALMVSGGEQDGEVRPIRPTSYHSLYHSLPLDLSPPSIYQPTRKIFSPTIAVPKICNQTRGVSGRTRPPRPPSRGLTAQQRRARHQSQHHDPLLRVNMEDNEKDSATTIGDCVICLDETVTHVLVPCGHACLCRQCATALLVQEERDYVCPLCRLQFREAIPFYVSSQPPLDV